MSYDTWTESFADASQLEQERDNADQDDWNNELRRDREILLEDLSMVERFRRFYPEGIDAA